MNWNEIKPKMASDFREFGKFTETYLELFYDVISYQTPNPQMRSALSLRYEIEKVSVLQEVRNLLASQIEVFFKRVFEFCQIEEKGEQSACFKQFFDDYFKTNFKNRNLFFNDRDDKSPQKAPAFFKEDLFGYGESLKTIYDLRNACTHEGKMEAKIIYPNAEVFLNDYTLFLGQIQHCLKSYLFIISKYHDKLKSGLLSHRKKHNTSYKVYLDQIKSSLLTREERKNYIELSVSFGKKDLEISPIHIIREKHNKLFILGGAGTGKTFTLKYLASIDANNENGKIPVFIELGQIAHEGSIRTKISETLPDFSAIDLLEKGALALYIDALDEFPLKSIEKIRGEIKDLIRDTDCDIILSSRQMYEGYFDGLTEVKLLGLDTKQQKSYISLIIQDSALRKSFIDALPDYNGNLPEENSIYWFSNLVAVINEKKELITAIVFVEEFIEMLIQREKQKPNKHFSDYEHNFRLAMQVLAEFETLKDKNEELNLGLDALLIWALEMGLLSKLQTGLQFKSEVYQEHFVETKL